MSTNFYLRSSDLPSGPEGLHIGKSNFGRAFMVHVHPSLAINTLDDWRTRYHAYDAVIVDEYERTLSADELDARIMGQVHWGHPSDDRPWMASTASAMARVLGSCSHTILNSSDI